MPDCWPLTADPQHVDRGLVKLNEDAVVDLTQAEQLQDLLDFGRHLVDTADPDDEGQLRLAGHVKVPLLLGLPLQPKHRIVKVQPKHQTTEKPNKNMIASFVANLELI